MTGLLIINFCKKYTSHCPLLLLSVCGFGGCGLFGKGNQGTKCAVDRFFRLENLGNIRAEQYQIRSLPVLLILFAAHTLPKISAGIFSTKFIPYVSLLHRFSFHFFPSTIVTEKHFRISKHATFLWRGHS